MQIIEQIAICLNIFTWQRLSSNNSIVHWWVLCPAMFGVWLYLSWKMDKALLAMTEICGWIYNLRVTHKWYLNILCSKLSIKILLPQVSPTHWWKNYLLILCNFVSSIIFNMRLPSCSCGIWVALINPYINTIKYSFSLQKCIFHTATFIITQVTIRVWEILEDHW